MLIIINGDNKERGKAWRIVLDLHSEIVGSRVLFFFNMNSLFYLELETGRGVIQ